MCCGCRSFLFMFLFIFTHRNIAFTRLLFFFKVSNFLVLSYCLILFAFYFSNTCVVVVHHHPRRRLAPVATPASTRTTIASGTAATAATAASAGSAGVPSGAWTWGTFGSDEETFGPPADDDEPDEEEGAEFAVLNH